MAKHINAVDTAKIIRKELKAKFPNTKFSVTSKSFAGGSSISINWTDGAAKTDVEKLTKIFSGVSFDGSQDLEVYSNSLYEGEEVLFGHYLHYNRDTSKEFLERVLAHLATQSERSQFLEIVGENNCRFKATENGHDEYCQEANKLVNSLAGDHRFEVKIQTQFKKSDRSGAGTFLIGYLSDLVGTNDISELYGRPTYDDTLDNDPDCDLFIQWVLEDTEGNILTLYLFKEDVEDGTYNIHIGGCDRALLKKLALDLPDDKVLTKSYDLIDDVPEYFKLNECVDQPINQPARPNLLKVNYKGYILDLINSDRLEEIETFETWRNKNSQEILQLEYKDFVQTCIKEGNLTAIKSFEDWLIIAM